MTVYAEYQAKQAEQDRLTKLAKDCVHKCGGMLTVTWDGESDRNRIRCGKCCVYVSETELVKRRSLTRQYEDGEILNPAIVNRIETKEAKAMAQEIGVDKARAVAPFRQVTALTRAQATEILLTIWPGASKVAVTKAAMICAQYHLNPLMKHVSLLCFNKGKQNESWEPAIGIKANRLMGCRKGTYSYLDNTPRAMTEAEQVTINGEVQPDRIWAIVKLRDEKTGACVQGTGFWPRDKDIQGADKGNTKQNMAQIHAERQAIDRLRPGEMPSDIEVFDEQYISAPTVQIIEVPKTEQGTRSVNLETGEIEEGNFREEPGNEPVTKQDDKDPLAAWTGTSRPQQASAGPQKTGIGPHSGPDIQPEASNATVATATRTEQAKEESTGECPPKIRKKIEALCAKLGKPYDDEQAKKLRPSQVDAQIKKLEAELEAK